MCGNGSLTHKKEKYKSKDFSNVTRKYNVAAFNVDQ